MPHGTHPSGSTMNIISHLPHRLVGILASAAMVLLPALVVDETSVLAGEPVSEQAVVSAGAVIALDALARWTEGGDTAAYLGFLDSRDLVAATVASTLGLDDSEMVEAWAASDLDGQVAVLAALSQLGVPYRRYSSIPGEAFDCSGLTRYSWKIAGVDIERSSGNQFRAGDEVRREEAAVGDLVWYPGHVMLYLGLGDAIVHSPTRGRTVEYQILSERRSNWIRFSDPTPGR